MIRLVTLSAAVLAALSFGCQTGRHSASPGLAPAQGSSPSIVHVVGNEAGDASESGAGGTRGSDAGSGGAAGDNAGGASDAPLFGANEIVSAAVASCEKAAISRPLSVLPASPLNAIYDRLGTVGDHRFAYSRDAQTLLTFDSAGNLSTALNDVAAVASNGTELSVVFQDATRTILQRYDETLNAQGPNVKLADGEARSLAAASTATTTLVSSIAGDQLLARVVAGDAIVELSIPLGDSAGHCRSQAVSAGTNFALIYACTGTPNEVRWALISDAGKLLKTAVVLEPAVALDLTAFKAIGTGYVLMLHSLEQKSAYLVRIDAKGQVDGAIRAVSGLLQAFDLAASSSGVSLTGMLEDGTTALGRIGDDAAPNAEGAWTCLDQTSPGGNAALETVKQVDSVLVHYGNGSEWLMTLPH